MDVNPNDQLWEPVALYLDSREEAADAVRDMVMASPGDKVYMVRVVGHDGEPLVVAVTGNGEKSELMACYLANLHNVQIALNCDEEGRPRPSNIAYWRPNRPGEEEMAEFAAPLGGLDAGKENADTAREVMRMLAAGWQGDAMRQFREAIRTLATPTADALRALHDAGLSVRDKPADNSDDNFDLSYLSDGFKDY